MKPVAALLPLLLLIQPMTHAQNPRFQPNLAKIVPPPSVPLFPLNLLTIDPIRTTQQLKEAVVTAFRPAIHQEIDRISYDVQADPESKSNDALEMLRKVPMITVDGNDNIQLKGSNNFLIFLNGKPSALMTNNPQDVLKSLPAATVQKIEVITVPPAKYDAEGVIGIINIITVKKNDEGYNASLFGRYNTVFGERGSVSFSAKYGKFGLSLFLGAAHQPDKTTASGSELTNFSPASNLSQLDVITNGANIHNGQTQLNFNPDSLDLINGFFDFFDRRFTQNTLLNTTLTESSTTTNIGAGTVGALDAGISVQHSSPSLKGELLTIAGQYSQTTNIRTNSISPSDSAYSHQQFIQADWILPIRNWTMETGAKTSFTVNTGTQFTYNQTILAAYNSWQLKVTRWTIKAGLRMENTDITPLTRNFNNLIPVLSFQYGNPATGSFTIGYTNRIQRPGLQQLNPFVDRSNPEFISTGNPSLLPVTNHIFEFDYIRPGKTPVNLNLSYAFAGNTIQNVTLLLNDTVSESTWSNLGSTRNAGINFSTSLPLTKRINLNVNAQYSGIWITGTYNSQFYRNNGVQGNGDLFARWSLDHGFTINVDFDYQSGKVLLQGKTAHWTSSRYNITKDLLNNKLILSITIYDPYATFNYGHSITKTPDFTQSTYNQFYYRQFRFAVNYKFGQLKVSDKPPTE
ncbi:MAG TPA: outer membrane beta-barrel protein [Puia sp.]|jgi:outer membrane receptor for ferrienterochelin and colicin|nr:outer membrane beta-barrel protein [Puia sp.]